MNDINWDEYTFQVANYDADHSFSNLVSHHFVLTSHIVWHPYVFHLYSQYK